jgi:hypothetical protein
MRYLLLGTHYYVNFHHFCVNGLKSIKGLKV